MLIDFQNSSTLENGRLAAAGAAAVTGPVATTGTGATTGATGGLTTTGGGAGCEGVTTGGGWGGAAGTRFAALGIFNRPIVMPVTESTIRSEPRCSQDLS